MQLKRQYKKACIIGCLLAGAAVAQTEDGLRASIANLHYTPLAEQARIQGDVRLKINAGIVALVSGHGLLAPPAIYHAKTIGSIEGHASLDVTYHFIILDNAISVPTSRTVKRGNALERLVLRALGFKTERL